MLKMFLTSALSARVGFTKAWFFAAAPMVGSGLLFQPLGWWPRGYLAMGRAIPVSGIEDARTGRLLMDADRPAL